MRHLSFAFLLCLAGTAALSAQTDSLARRLRDFVRPYRAQVGVAVIIDHTDTVCLNDDADYPLLSVVKFHQALAVADRLHHEGLTLDAPVPVRRRDLRPGTYSPLRDRLGEADTVLTVRELLRYTMQLSDNNACDILFRRFGGPRATQRYLRGLGFRGFAIRHDEAAMHRRPRRCRANRTSPLDAARLVEYVRTHEMPGQECLDYVFRLMETCETGKDRLPAPLEGTGAIVGHKTGTGDADDQGRIVGTNDVGYVWRPGHHGYSIAVFVKDSEEPPATNAALIAGISRIVWQYVDGLPPVPK